MSTPPPPAPLFQSPSTSQMGRNLTIVTHSSIVSFAGIVNGRMPQPVESFIEALDAHLVAKGITDDSTAYLEARSYLDYVKGDLGFWARTFSFKVCEKWSDLKKLLRQAYTKDVSQDEVLFLRSIVRSSDRKGRSIVQTAAELSDGLVELADRLKSSPWVKGTDNDGDHYLTLEKVILLLQLSLITSALPDRLVALFDEPLDDNASELTVVEQIRKQAQKIPDLDPTILNGTDKNKQNTGSVATAPVVNNRQSTPSSPARNSKVECFNCGRFNHFARDCNAVYCNFHRTNSHKYTECRARRSNRNSKSNGATQARRDNQNSNYNRKQYENVKKNKVATVTGDQDNKSVNEANFQRTPKKSTPT